MPSIFSKYNEDIPVIEFKLGNTLFSIQHMRFKDIGNVPEHKHCAGCYEIHLIRKGYGKFIVEDITHNFSPGTLIFIGPNVRHEKLVTDKMETIAAWINIFARKLPDSNTQKNIPTNNIPIDDLFLNTSFWKGTATENFTNMMDIAIKELIRKEAGYQKIVESCVISMIVTLSRNFHSDRPLHKESSLTALKYPVIIDDYFLVDYNNLSLPGLADKLNLSERQTQRILRQNYGKSFQDMKLEARMHAAKMLIETETNLSMSDISIKLGYPSLEYFSSTFRKFFGYSPREYKKNLENTI